MWWALHLVMDRVVFFSPESEMTKGSHSHLTFRPPRKHKQLRSKMEKKEGWKVYTALTTFSN